MIVGNADNDCVAFSGLEHFLGGGVVFYTFTKLFLEKSKSIVANIAYRTDIVFNFDFNKVFV